MSTDSPDSRGDLRSAGERRGSMGDLRNLKSALEMEVTVGTNGLLDGDWNRDALDLPVTPALWLFCNKCAKINITHQSQRGVMVVF